MNVSYDFFPVTSSRFGNSRWGQLFDFSPTVGLVEITSAGNAQEEGIAYISRLSRFLSNLSKLPSLLDIKKNVDPKQIRSFLLCHIEETKCTLALVGKGKVFLRRGKILAPLLTREGTLTGEIRDLDCLVFLSETAVELVRAEEQELFSPRLTAKEIAEALNVRLSQKGALMEGAALLVLQINRPTPVVSPIQRVPNKISLKERIKYKVQSLSSWTKHPKFFPYLGVSLLTIFFVVSVILGIQRQRNDVVYKQRQQAQETAQALLDEAIAISELQPFKSRELFKEAQAALAAYTGKNVPRGKEGKAIETLQKQIADGLKLVSKIYNPTIQLFYDASFLQKERVVSLFAVGDEALAFADVNSGTIGVVSLQSKDAQVVAGGSEFVGTKFLAFQNQRLLAVTADGVKAIAPGKEGATTILKHEESWDAFTAFGTNLYGIVRSEGEIIRYPGKEGGFGEKERYLAEDVHAELSHSSGIVIDGSVWIGSTIGKIFRYTQGRDDSFLIRGVEPPLGQKLEVFVSEDSPTVYVFDPEEKRIVFLSKEGNYQAQYLWDDTIAPTAFGVSPLRKRIFLLSNQKIYSFVIE